MLSRRLAKLIRTTLIFNSNARNRIFVLFFRCSQKAIRPCKRRDVPRRDGWAGEASWKTRHSEFCNTIASVQLRIKGDLAEQSVSFLLTAWPQCSQQ